MPAAPGDLQAPAFDTRAATRPRVLVISPDFPPARGGVQVSVHRIVSGLERLEAHVVTLDAAGGREHDVREGLRVTRVKAPGGAAPVRNVVLNAAALATAARVRPDLTLSAHVVTSPAAAAIAALSGAPTVQCFYAKEIGHRPRLAAFAARRAATVLSISSYTTELLTRVGIPRERPILIPPGVDLPADARPEPTGRPTIVTVSRLEDRYKGHDVMLRALARVRVEVPDVQWIVVGDGFLRAELERLAVAEGVEDCVRFVGAVADDERNRWLRRADLLAMPSRLPEGTLAGEGFGIVYMEAGAHGKPVVAGNVGGAVDAVVDGETGLLVDPADPAAVAAAIVRLLRDPVLARRLGGAAAERAREFSWPRIVVRVEQVLLDTLARSGRPTGRPAGRERPAQRLDNR
jgi:phosphatidylinositol alpha-1,6-mannosyltransferase